MRFIPDNFSIAGLSAIDRRNLNYYYEKFVIRRFDIYGYGHFALACYAALPAVLTPDLLNKIWLNFKEYRWEDKTAIIHPVASTDLLLSPLVEEIGLELYEMAEPLRKALLFHLKETTSSPEKNTLGFYSVQDIAEFLRDYVQFDFTPENRDDNAFREAQVWTAMSYLDPGKAFMQVSRAFQEAAAKESKAEMVRYKDAMEKMSARFSINIVKDPALIPQAFQAMTSLTSVVRDVLQNQEPARLEEFKARTREAGNNVLTDTIVLDENVISIEIPGAVEEKINGLEQKKEKDKRKIKALVIGIGGYHITKSRNAEFNMNNAAVFASLLTEIIPATNIELVRIMNSEATKSNILQAWEQLLRDAGENDDIIVYFSADTKGQDGQCYVICDDTDISSDNRSSWLADREIGERAKQSRCASVTAILELDHAGTPYWLDLSDPKNIVFTASKYEDNSPSLTMPNPRGHVIFLFTWALDKILREIRMQITNRSLFISVLQEYEKAAAKMQSKQDDKGTHAWEKKAPQFFCNPEAFDRFFLQGNNSRVELQSLLRQTNCYDGAVTGEWDTQTANAFAASKKKYALPDDLFRQNYIEKLKKIKKDQVNEEAVFLFVFSNTDRRLLHIEEERKNIMAFLSGKEKMLNARIEVLTDPDSQKLIDAITDKRSRNRIKLFYYAGKDNMGDFVLRDGPFRLPEFAALLGYQENIELFVSNSCRSQYFADYVSQLGVYRAVGSENEVEDSYSASFGVDLIKEFTEGRDIDKFIETPSLSVLEKRSTSAFNKFVLFKASWQPKDRLVIEKNNPKAELKKPTLFAVIIGIGTSNTQLYPIDNARRFGAYLSSINNENLVKMASVPDNGNISRRDAFDMLNLFSEAQEGDTCLLFYSGEAISTNNMENGFIDFLFSDDTEVMKTSVSIKDKLFSVAGQRNIQLVIIADLHGALITDTDTSSILVDLSPFILIQNCSPYKLHATRTGKPDNDNNWFFISLMELLNDGGTHLTYADLYSRLVIRMSQTEEKNRPKMIANPVDVVNNVFLTGKGRVKVDYSVWYDADKGWIVDAGAIHGIHPSLYFMRTLLRLSASQIVAVDKVYEDYSMITGAPEDSRNVRFTAELLQNAIPKIKIAFDPAIDSSMQHDLESAINQYDIYAIDIVEKIEAAKYVISSKDNQYSLLVKASIKERQEAPPVFDYESIPFEFIKQMEYIARWKGVLELDNTKAKINDNSIQVSFEVLEGVESENLATAHGILVNDPDRIILHYKEDTQPAFRCIIKSLGSKRLYATVLYFDSTYGINDLHTYVLNPGKESRITFEDKRGMPNHTIAVFLDKHYEKMGKHEIYDYVKIFICEEEIDITPVIQPSLKFGRQPITRGIGMQKSLGDKLFELSRSGWSTTTIPIKIVKEPHKKSSDEKPEELEPLESPSSNAKQEKQEKKESKGILQVAESFRKTVQELYDSIPVTVKDDPQKNRWGNRSVNRGKKLTATVQNSPKPGYFNIRIALTADYGERPLTGDVAFFLHPTFKEFIKYKKAMNGKAEIAIKGYSAFVVGVYTEDGIMLELDLQQVKGFPKEFYYAENEPEAGEFYTEENILGLVTKRITTKGDSVRSSLLIFRTLQQRTWLVATGKHIYVILDDPGTRRKKDLIMTFFDKSAVLPLETRKSENFKGAMVVKFSAQDTWWYYSNELFPTKERLVEAVKQLIEASSSNYIEKEKNIIASVEDIAINDSFSTYPVSKYQSNIQNVETGIEQYFIVNKCIIHFDGNVITQKRLDVLNSILIAQLAADKQFSAAEQGVEWQNFFISVLIKIGWTIETSGFSSFNSSTSIFETGSAIIEIMSAAFGTYGIGIIYKALSAVRAMDETQMMKDFEKNTHSSTKGLFLTAVIKEEKAVTALNLNTFFLTSATEIKKILFFKSSKDTTKLEYSTCQGTLSEEIYKPVREAIITKIGERASQFIAEIVV